MMKVWIPDSFRAIRHLFCKPVQELREERMPFLCDLPGRFRVHQAGEPEQFLVKMSDAVFDHCAMLAGTHEGPGNAHGTKSIQFVSIRKNPGLKGYGLLS